MPDTAALLAELRAQRAHVRAALVGLTHEQMLTPVPPTTWMPIAVPHHLALDVERWWFQAIVRGDAGAAAYFEANPNGAWAVPSGTDALALYEAESAVSDSIIAGTDQDVTPAAWPAEFGAPRTLGQIVLHVIGETAAHAGQLDIVRQTIDGRLHLVLD